MKNLLYRLGALLILRGMVAIFGPRYTMIGSLGLLFLAAAFLFMSLYDHHKIRRLKRSFCDDAIFYARKKRHAFGEPDYSDSEIAEMKAPRNKGDFTQVQALIAAANRRLHNKQQSEQRQAKSEADKAASAIRRRHEEVRMYRA